MKISATEAGIADRSLIFLDENGELGPWLLFESSEIILRGAAGEPLPASAAPILAVPGEEVAIHWLALAEGLAPAQATAAARLLLADASAEPIADLHVAIGRPEQGLTPVALVPARQMKAWIEAAAGAGIDTDLIVPSPMLLPVPETGFVVRARGALSDYRAAAAAFSLEPDLAALVLDGAEARPVDDEQFEDGLTAVLADPPLNLRQGAFARRRQWRVDSGAMRRVGLLALLFLALTLAVQVTSILRYTFAADALEEEARSLRSEAGPPLARSFAAPASILFDSIRATPNVELSRIDYRADGRLTATLLADSPASLLAVAQRAEASGMGVEQGAPRNAGGGATVDFVLRAP
jgi:general secretion pathway protein L